MFTQGMGVHETYQKATAYVTTARFRNRDRRQGRRASLIEPAKKHSRRLDREDVEAEAQHSRPRRNHQTYGPSGGWFML